MPPLCFSLFVKRNAKNGMRKPMPFCFIPRRKTP